MSVGMDGPVNIWSGGGANAVVMVGVCYEGVVRRSTGIAVQGSVCVVIQQCTYVCCKCLAPLCEEVVVVGRTDGVSGVFAEQGAGRRLVSKSLSKLAAPFGR